jgi:uncharacterized membrane protein YphA (DoxX/SURF4 family)
MATTYSVVAPGKGQVIASWILRVLLAVAFLAAAGAKLAGVPMLVQVFEQIGLGDWFRYVTAIVEIVGVAGLFIPGVTALAALWLGVTMFFALLTHLFILHTSPAGAVVLLVLAIVLAWLQRAQLARFR